jgi:CcmD family protein
MAVVVCLVATPGDAVTRALAMQPAGEPQGEFVPISELPPGDQLPAAPLLVAAYAFVWIAIFGYLWSIWRRLQKVDAELAALAKRVDTRR